MSTALDDYVFPVHRLRAVNVQQPKRQPLVIVACGSFSPITYLHLRMFEMARDYIEATNKFQILGGYFSPVSDAYNKYGLAEGVHRVRMVELALEHSSDWLMVDSWETRQPEFQRTALVLDHFHNMLNQPERGLLRNAVDAQGAPLWKEIRVVLLAGGDLIESFQVAGLWAVEDLHHILGGYGCLVLERTGSDTHSFLLENDILYQHRRNVFVVKQLIHNDISSSKVRLFVKRGFSIKYLLPDPVIAYIEQHRLFRD